MQGKTMISLLLASVILVFSGCSAADGNNTDVTGSKHEKEIFAMDTIMKLTAWGASGEQALEEAEAEIRRLDDLLSTGKSTSEVSAINRSGGSTQLSDEVRFLAERSLDIYEATDGAFDMTIYPIMKLWGFTGDDPACPSDDSIERTLALCGSDKVKLDNSGMVLSEGQSIDLGGIAKGYTGMRIADIFRKNGIGSGIVSLGGNVQCIGGNPSGKDFNCAVADPAAPHSSYLGFLKVNDEAVVTSGGYERYFEDDGVTYHHIMDPRTGRPAKSGLSSVTVVCRDGTTADGLSTACFVMGAEKSAELWRSGSYSFELVLFTDDGRLLVTEGLSERFSPDGDRGFEIIRKE